MSHMMTMRNQRRPLGLLLLTVALLPFISFGKEDRNPTCEQVNSEYDDGVVCNEPDSTTDFSHDLSALDPNQAPKRCDDWNIEMLNLNEMDPLYVCIEWHRLYGELKPATRAPTAMPSIVPTLSPTMSPTTAPPIISPTPAPTQSSTLDETTTNDRETNDTDTKDNDTDTNDNSTTSILIDEFTLRIVVPKEVKRRNLQQKQEVPYNQVEFTEIINAHIYNYLESELNRNVAAVDLRSISSQVSALQGSTVVQERMSGTVEFTGPEEVPSPRTVNALTLQALEENALWEFFFRLRGASDVYLQKTQQVTLVDSTFSNAASEESSTSGSSLSVGVIVTFVVIGVATASIVGYFVYWLKKQHDLEKDEQRDAKKSAETPDTQTSDEQGPFFENDVPPPVTHHSRSFTKKKKKRLHTEEMSDGNLSFVSSVNSALHSIRERSMEDEEEDDDSEQGGEMQSRDRLWDDDMDALKIEMETQLVENMPPMNNYNKGDDQPIVEDYGQIHRIMPLETTYSTNIGTEVTRRELELPAEKPAKRWMWKKTTRGAQKRNTASKPRQAAARANVQRPVNSFLDRSLDPPSMVCMSLDPPSQCDLELSGLENSLDPPSQINMSGSFSASETSLDGENLMEFEGQAKDLSYVKH